MQDLNNQFSPNNLPENNPPPLQPEPMKPSATPEEPMPKKRKSKIVLKVLIVAIVLLLVGAGAFGAVLYTRVYDPIWSPFRPSPEQVLQNMLQNMQNVKTVSTQTKMGLSTDDGKKINIDFGGDSDVTDKFNPKSSMKASIISSDTATNLSDSLKAEMMVVDKDLYFKISEMNAPSFGMMFLMFGVDPLQVIGTWVKVPKDFQKTIAEKDSIATRALTEAEIAQFTEKMQKIVAENNIFIVKEELADTVVNGEKMYNYVLVINNDNLLKVFGEIMQESINMQNDLVASSPYMIGAMKGAMQEALNKIGEIKINVLIGRKDNLLYGFDVLKTIDLADLTQGDVKGKINVSLQATESNFNESVNIIAPSKFKTIEEIFPIEEFIK
jgi:hypothetical protein